MARHHQSKRSRMDEERGEEKYLRGPVKMQRHSKHYGMPHRREMHRSGSGSMSDGSYSHESAMIHEDPNAPCLLPTNVIHRDYPSAPRAAMSMVGEDLYQGAQRQMEADERELRHLKTPRRW